MIQAFLLNMAMDIPDQYFSGSFFTSFKTPLSSTI